VSRRLIFSSLLLGIIQLLIGVDMFFRGWSLLTFHIIIAIALLGTLLISLYFSSGRVRRHIIVTVILVLVQGSLGLYMVFTGSSIIEEIIHWSLGIAIIGSLIGTYIIRS